MRQELNHKQQCFRYIKAFLDGGSVTCNTDVLTGGEVKALEYLQGEGVVHRDPPKGTRKEIKAMDPNDASGRWRLSPDKVDRAKELLIYFDRAIRQHLEKGR